jgi:HEAT repeat protein
LIQALKDNDSQIRANAAEALGNIGDTRSVRPLIQALKDDNINVRNEAAHALDKLGCGLHAE